MRTQVPLERQRQREHVPHYMAGKGIWPPTEQASSNNGSLHQQRNTRPKTLGSIVENNHGVLHQIRDFDEFASNIDHFQSLSMTSSADMARAQAQQTFSGDGGDPIHFEMSMPQQEVRQPLHHERRHPQPTHSRDSGRDAPPIPEPMPMPRAVQYWGKQQEAKENRRRSAFAGIQPQQLRSIPNNALADEAVMSPNSSSGRGATIRCHGASSTYAPKPVDNNTDGGPQSKPLSTGSIFEFFSAKNLIRSCTPSLPADDEDSKTQKKSIWAYLDPNDDLEDYDDMRSLDAIDTSDDEDDDSDRVISKHARRERCKHVPRTGSARPPSTDSFRQAYEDLMFIDNRRTSPSGRGAIPSQHRPQVPGKYRSSTPNTTGSRSSNTHTTLDHESAGRPSPTLSQIREDLWGNVPTRRSIPNHRRQHGPQSYQSEHIQHSGGMPDPRTISSDPVNSEFCSTNRAPPRPVHQPAHKSNSSHIRRTPPQQKIHADEEKRAFDPFSLGRSRLQPRDGQRDSTVNKSTTPRTSNHQGFHEPRQCQNNPNIGNTTRRNSFAPSSRDTAPRRGRSNSDRRPAEHVPPAAEDRNQSTEAGSGEKKGSFPFAPDFYMFEALKTEIAGGFRGTSQPSPSEEFPTISVEDGDDPQLSNLSESSDLLTLGYERRKQGRRYNKVKRKGMENFEILQQMRQEHNAQKLNQSIPRGKQSAASATMTPSQGEIEGIPSKPASFDGHHMYVAYSRFGEYARDVLQLCEHQSLPPVNSKSGEILVKVLASTISTSDCDIRRGEWSTVRLNPYIVPGVAFVGVIHATDRQKNKRTSKFAAFRTGDFVMALAKSGGNARYRSVEKDQLIKVPQHLDPCMVVCLAETYLTAFQALHIGQRGALRYRNNAFKGQSILVLNGSSSLGRAMIEVALAGGADYCYALAKERQYDAIGKLGGIPLPKEPQEWLTLVGRQINTMVIVTDRNGLYTDPITRDHMKAICDDGQVVFVGPPGLDCRQPNIFSSPASPSPSKLICKSVKNNLMDRSFSYNVHDSWDADTKLAKRDLEHLVELMEGGRVRPDVLERVPLSKVAKVHSILETKKISGYIVCSPWFRERTLAQQSSTGLPSVGVPVTSSTGERASFTSSSADRQYQHHPQQYDV